MKTHWYKEPDESWRLIPGFPNYIVSDKGRVVNTLRDRLIKPTERSDGLMQVMLSQRDQYTGLLTDRKAMLVSKLVAMAFLPDYDPDKIVVHISNDRKDNSIYNIKMSRTIRRGIWKDYDILCIETGDKYLTVSEAARDMGLSRQSLSAHINGRGDHAGGYTFKRVPRR